MLEDRIRTSVDQAVQALVSDLLSIHTDATARQVDEAAERVREMERGRAELEQKLAEADEAREAAIDEAVRAAVEGEAARHAARVEDQIRALHEQHAAAIAAIQGEAARHTAQAGEQMRTLHDEHTAALAAVEARAIAETKASIDAARVGEREAEMAGFTRLVESVRGLDGATSLSEVLDALALAAAREAARAAVVVVKGDHVVGWRLSGFGPRDAQPKSVDLPLVEAGVIGAAASSSRPATTQSGADGPGFEHLPEDRMGLAMPVLVGGRVVAVVYADGVSGGEQDHIVPNPWPEAIDVLARHAGRCLEALTAQRVAAPARSSAQSGVVTPAPSGAVG